MLTSTTQIREWLTARIAERSGVDPHAIDRFDSFFQVGFTSIDLVRLATRVREVWGRNIPFADLYRNATTAALAALLDGREPPSPPDDSGAVNVADPPPRSAHEGPASPGQEQLWFAERLQPGRSTYHVHVGLRMRGRLDVNALRAALTDVAGRHGALRTRFHEVDGRPCWTVRPVDETLPLDIVSVDVPEGQAREDDVHERAHVHARVPFGLEDGALIRADLMTFDPEDALLLVTQHHLVTDGWSVGIFGRDLIQAYCARAGGQAPDWRPLPLEHGDFIVREREWLQCEEAAQARAWWRERLAGLPPLELPFRRRVAGLPSDRGESRGFQLSASLTEELQALAAREGTTLFAVLFAAFAALLHRYSGADDFGVGIVTANRSASDRIDMIGFLANTVVLRCDMSGRPTFSAWLARASHAAMEALAHERLPFFELTRLVDGTRRGLNPLVETCFAFENVPLPEIDLPGLMCRPMLETPDAGVSGTAKFDLTLVIAPAREGLSAEFQFATDLFDGPAVEQMIGRFCALLAGAVRHPRSRLSQLPWLTAEERNTLVAWNTTGVPHAAEPCLHELIENAGGADAGGAGGRRRGSGVELRRAQSAREPAGAPVARARRRARRPCGPVHASAAGNGRGHAGRAQGGRRVRAARSELSARAAGLHPDTPRKRASFPASRGFGVGLRRAPREPAVHLQVERRQHEQREERGRRRAANHHDGQGSLDLRPMETEHQLSTPGWPRPACGHSRAGRLRGDPAGGPFGRRTRLARRAMGIP